MIIVERYKDDYRGTGFNRVGRTSANSDALTLHAPPLRLWDDCDEADP